VRFHECFGAAGGGTLEVSLHEDNAKLLSFLLRHYAADCFFS
jgi:hypothetical protein